MELINYLKDEMEKLNEVILSFNLYEKNELEKILENKEIKAIYSFIKNRYNKFNKIAKCFSESYEIFKNKILRYEKKEEEIMYSDNINKIEL